MLSSVVNVGGISRMLQRKSNNPKRRFPAHRKVSLGTSYLGILWLTFYLQELKKKKVQSVIISFFMPYFKITIIQKKHEEVDHHRFN